MSERTHLGDTPDSGDQFERYCIGGSSLQSAIREEFSDLTRTSVPRALQRLDERDLVTRWTGRPPRHSRISPDASRGNHLTLVMLTQNGGRVAEEILRRHEDGRYSLSFDTLD